MAKYRLLQDHVIDAAIVPKGTEIGEGTSVVFKGEPSVYMVGLDGEGKSKVRELHQRLYGKDGPEDKTEDVEVEDEHGRKKTETQVTRAATGPASVTATPIQDQKDENVQKRTAKPLDEQLPKGG